MRDHRRRRILGRVLQLTGATLLCLAALLAVGACTARADDGQGSLHLLGALDQAYDIQQRHVFEVEVQVRDATARAWLAALGYECPLGVCALEVPAGQEMVLTGLGLEARVVNRAIVATATRVASTGSEASALWEGYLDGRNDTNYDIPDAECNNGGIGTAYSSFDLSGAPYPEGEITKVVYSLRVRHGRLTQLKLFLGYDFCVWNQWGTAWGTDAGRDDDDEDDDDIDLRNRETTSLYAGVTPNRTWQLRVEDWDCLFVGIIDYFAIRAYYECPVPGAPVAIYPPPGTTDIEPGASLLWIKGSNAMTTDLYLGTAPDPPYIGSAGGEQWVGPDTRCGTTYYWKLVSKSNCGTTAGPVCSFRTKCCRPGEPSSPYPPSGYSEISRDTDLNWADAAGATSYDVYFGAGDHYSATYQGTTAVSSWTLAKLACGTHYSWYVVPKNSCGPGVAPWWGFTTTANPPQASGPVPANHATGVSLDANLDWNDVSPVTSYSVGYGATNPPKGSGTTTSSALALGPLSPNTKYYWYVNTVNVDCTTAGTLWDFTTGCVPATPHSPSPADGAGGVLLGTVLDWPDLPGASSYDVYFGTASPPAFVGNTASSNYTPLIVRYGTRHYWKVVAKSTCGNTAGPEWDFTTVSAATATPSRTPTRTATPTSTQTRTATPTSSPSATLSATRTSTATPTHTVTATPSRTLTPTPSPTHTATSTATPSRTPTQSPTATAIGAPTSTVTRTPTSTSTSQPSPTRTRTSTLTPTPTGPLPTATRTGTPTHTATAQPLTRTPTRTLAPGQPTATCAPPEAPGSPSPADDAEDISCGEDLDWADATGADYYRVYLGTSARPAFYGVTTDSSYALTNLTCNTHYYWQVVAECDCGSRAGAVWEFTTLPCNWILLPLLMR